MEHRIPNVIYSEPQMALWKRALIRLVAAVGALIAAIVLYAVRTTYGDLYTITGSVILCAVALALAFWCERWKRQRKRLLKQSQE
jgi:hypothetical protein